MTPVLQCSYPTTILVDGEAALQNIFSNIISADNPLVCLLGLNGKDSQSLGRAESQQMEEVIDTSSVSNTHNDIEAD